MAIDKYFVACERVRPTETMDSSRRPITTYASTDIRGYIGSGSNNQYQASDKETVISELKFYCNDFNMLINDLVRYEGKTYEVCSEPKNTAHKNSHIKVSVRKVDEVKQH